MEQTIAATAARIEGLASHMLRKPWIDAPVWVMLTALAAVAAMSQAFRTVATVVAGELQTEFGASAQALGIFAGAFHLSFAASQIVIGVALDVFGPRRTVIVASTVALLGVAISAVAPSFPALVIGQLLIGIGCAPAFLGTIIFVAKRYPADQFTRLSGLVLSFSGIGSGIGMLLTGTPLAYVVETWSWRAGFLALGAVAALVLLAVVLLVREEPPQHSSERETVREAFRKIGPILSERHTLGLVVLGLAAYASFITLRGLWAVPMLVDRHGFSVVQSGHVVLAMSVAALIGPPLFGLLKVGDRARRLWIIGSTLAYVGLFVVLALAAPSATADIATTILLGLLSGYFILQYADVRAAYPGDVAGRAFAVFNTAVFLGVALMQWLTGLVASVATSYGADPFVTAFATIAALLVAATLAFVVLPWPPGIRRAAPGG
jgi:predicted MFS family arabinose efflux permease